MKKKNNIEKIELNIKDIPVTIFRPENFSEEGLTIIHYHGWTSEVSKFFSFAELFAQRGFQVILPELTNHGIRKQNKDEKEYIRFIDSVLNSVDEFEIIGNYLVENDLVNKFNIILSGHSMGGFIVNILRGLWNIKSSITYNGIGDVLSMFEKDLSKDNLGDLSEEAKKKLDRMIELNPMTNFKLYDNKKMLVLIGLEDEVVSPKNMQKFLDKLNKERVNTDQIIFKYFEKAKHDISFEMIREALAYIQGLSRGDRRG